MPTRPDLFSFASDLVQADHQNLEHLLGGPGCMTVDDFDLLRSYVLLQDSNAKLVYRLEP